jgi:hypothetical protein
MNIKVGRTYMYKWYLKGYWNDEFLPKIQMNDVPVLVYLVF